MSTTLLQTDMHHSNLSLEPPCLQEILQTERMPAANIRETVPLSQDEELSHAPIDNPKVHYYSPAKNLMYLSGDNDFCAPLRLHFSKGQALAVVTSYLFEGLTSLELVYDPHCPNCITPEQLSSSLTPVAALLDQKRQEERQEGAAFLLQREFGRLLADRIDDSTRRDIYETAFANAVTLTGSLLQFPGGTDPLCAILCAEICPLVVLPATESDSFGRKVDLIVQDTFLLQRGVFDILLSQLDALACTLRVEPVRILEKASLANHSVRSNH